MPTPDLYEQDFVAWSQAQAEALRDAGRAGGRSHAVEWERVAEELEDLGKSQYFAVRSFTTQALAHLFKLAWTSREEPKAGWRAEIALFRLEAETRMTASLRRKLEEDLDALHRDALKLAAASFEAREPGVERDESLRWSLPEILGE